MNSKEKKIERLCFDLVLCSRMSTKNDETINLGTCIINLDEVYEISPESIGKYLIDNKDFFFNSDVVDLELCTTMAIKGINKTFIRYKRFDSSGTYYVFITNIHKL